MEYLTPFAIVWVVVFLILGHVRGFWKALGGVLSFVAGGAASVLFTAAFARYLLNLNFVHLGDTATSLIAAFVLFVGTGVLVRVLVFYISRRFPITQSSFDAWGGACVSGVYGACMATMLVWGASFLIESLALRQGSNSIQHDADTKALPPLVTFSREMMSGMVGWYLRQVGASDQTAHFAAVYAERPQQVLSAVQESMRSNEFKAVINSENIQGMMRAHNTEALQQTPEFTQLMQQPGVQKLRELFTQQNSDWTDQKIAEQMVDVWSGVEKVKERPEVKDLLTDPEFQSFLHEGGSPSPALLAKGQKLLAIIGNEHTPSVVGNNDHTAQADQPATAKPMAVFYKWRDDDGQLHITDYEKIPQDKLNQAQKISL